MNIDIPVVLNFEPHYLLLTFKNTAYTHITGSAVLEQVRKKCVEHYHLSSSHPPTWWKDTAQLQLRYVPDKVRPSLLLPRAFEPLPHSLSANQSPDARV